MLFGCSTGQNVKEKANIGIAVYDENDVFLASLINRYEENANQNEASLALNINVNGARRSQLRENQIVKEMISDGVDLLCINLVDRTDTSGIIKTAKEADIPVIFFNREPVESDLNRWNKLYYVGADAEESGRLQGEIAIQYIREHPETDLNDNNEIEYYVLEGETGHQDTIIRSEKSVEALKDAGIPLSKAGYSICDWNRDEAYAAVTALIRQGTQIELLLANNDEMAAGAVQAYDDAEIDMNERPVIVGIDGTETGVELVREGKMAGTVFNDYIGQADMIMELTKRLIQNQSTDDLNLIEGKKIYLPYQKITSENVNSYID